MREGDTLFYLLGDHLGSTSLTLDVNGNKVAEQRYKPYGSTRYEWGTAQTDYGFTGQRSRSYIGLVQMGSRFYDPALGRFSQPDAIVPGTGLPAGFDRYMFVFSNPLKYVDPTGNTPDCWDDDYACGADPNIEYDLEGILDEVPFDETFGGNIDDHHSSGNSNEEIDDLEESSNPPLEILVPINILLHGTTIVVEGGIVYAEVKLIPFALTTPVIGVPLELVLAGVGAVVLDVDVAFSTWVYRIYQNPQEKQNIEFLPPWGFDND